MFQPPLSIGSWLARRSDHAAPFQRPEVGVDADLLQRVGRHLASAQIVGIVGAARMTTFSPL